MDSITNNTNDNARMIANTMEMCGRLAASMNSQFAREVATQASMRSRSQGNPSGSYFTEELARRSDSLDLARKIHSAQRSAKENSTSRGVQKAKGKGKEKAAAEPKVPFPAILSHIRDKLTDETSR